MRNIKTIKAMRLSLLVAMLSIGLNVTAQNSVSGFWEGETKKFGSDTKTVGMQFNSNSRTGHYAIVVVKYKNGKAVDILQEGVDFTYSFENNYLVVFTEKGDTNVYEYKKTSSKVIYLDGDKYTFQF